MIQKVTLTIDGKEKTFQRIVTARMCRTAFHARMEYVQERIRKHDVITDEMIDKLIDWLVEAYDGQFTADQFLDGYSGSPLEICMMMEELITSVSDAVIDFPKRTPEEARAANPA